jgi:hypothetical protein
MVSFHSVKQKLMLVKYEPVGDESKSVVSRLVEVSTWIKKRNLLLFLTSSSGRIMWRTLRHHDPNTCIIAPALG